MTQVFHHYKKWECVDAGFFDTTAPEGKTDEECLESYRSFLSNLQLFESQIQRVFKEWPNSCEQFLTNESINRIAWIGQASLCIWSKIPSVYKSGYQRLTEEQKEDADNLAGVYLRKWLKEYAEKKAEERADQCQSDQLELTY